MPALIRRVAAPMHQWRLPPFTLYGLSGIAWENSGRQLNGKVILKAFGEYIADILAKKGLKTHDIVFPMNSQYISIFPPVYNCSFNVLVVLAGFRKNR